MRRRLAAACSVEALAIALVPFFEPACAQMPLPEAKSMDSAVLFRQQCATCHTTNDTDPQRQGPSLFKVVGRTAGKLPGFHYSSALAAASFAWDEARLDAWLTDPQEVVPGAVMPYRQSKPEIRARIISYLKDLH